MVKLVFERLLEVIKGEQMQLKPNTQKALDAWLGSSNWYTKDLRDMNRWHHFVDQYQREHGFTIDEGSLRENIEAKLTKIDGKRFENEPLRNEIRERISLACNILEFLERTGR